MVEYNLIEIMGVLSRQKRQDILARLGGGPRTVADLARELRLAHMTVRDNLRQLEQCGLVKFRSTPPQKLYELCSSVRVARQPGGGMIQITAPGGTMQLGGLKGIAWRPWE